MATIQTWFPMSNYYGILIPVGLIVPFNDIAANIPAGWSQWTTGANRALVGHSSIAGALGGSLLVTRESDTGDSGHTGTTYTGWMANTTAGAGGDMILNSVAGSHSHSAVDIGYVPAVRKQVMMKSSVASKMFPAKTGILSSSSIPGLTDITPTGYTLVGTSEASNSNVASSSWLNSVTTQGGHAHVSGKGTNVSPATAPITLYGQGASDHGGSVSVTDNIYRYYMGMWTNASAAMGVVPGMYALWESATPPAGWSICNGANGTPDLSGYHIGMDSGASIGTKTGNGTITTSGTLSTNGAHAHVGASAARNSTNPGRHSNSYSHSHSVGALATAFAPLQITIIFIKATG